MSAIMYSLGHEFVVSPGLVQAMRPRENRGTYRYAEQLRSSEYFLWRLMQANRRIELGAGGNGQDVGFTGFRHLHGDPSHRIQGGKCHRAVDWRDCHLDQGGKHRHLG